MVYTYNEYSTMKKNEILCNNVDELRDYYA